MFVNWVHQKFLVFTPKLVFQNKLIVENIKDKAFCFNFLTISLNINIEKQKFFIKFINWENI